MRAVQSLAPGEKISPRAVVTFGCSGGEGHEQVTHAALARRLAALLGFEFFGTFEDYRDTLPVYYVPRATLCGEKLSAQLKLRCEDDFFGGWVPFDHMATKAVVHPLVGPDALAPQGWSHGLAADAKDLTLRGYAAFCAADALTAGRELLMKCGPVRLKAIHADGGRGQRVVATADELEDAVHSLSGGDGLSDALVLEENLAEVVTYSVGQVRIGGTVASYCGTQELTTNNDGREAYGGSELLVARGDYEALLRLSLPGEMREAVECAMGFDRLVRMHLPDLIASRRNYDIASGRAADGQRRFGVLEQSWRAGGASGAEIAALEVFAKEPTINVVRARTVERYGEQPLPPDGAGVYFRGHDPIEGLLTKYAIVDERIDA